MSLTITDQANNDILILPWSQFPPTIESREEVIHYEPPFVVYSIKHDNLTYSLTYPSEVNALVPLELLHRLIDVLQEYLGEPLIASKIEADYDTVALILYEMLDWGRPNITETNLIHDAVPTKSLFNKILSNPSTGSYVPSSIPWRKANVKHTNNEMYVDIIETLHCIYSGAKPIVAKANGSIVFTSKLSGTPDLLLQLESQGITLPGLHPCVRTRKWNERPGTLSFIPPDGKFVLMSYEIDLGTAALPVVASMTIRDNTYEVSVSLKKVHAKLIVESVEIHVHFPLPRKGTESTRVSSGECYSEGNTLKWSFPKVPTVPSSMSLSGTFLEGGSPEYMALQFSSTGWLSSGFKVASLNVVRGLNEQVRPYRGVKYITRSGELIVRAERR